MAYLYRASLRQIRMASPPHSRPPNLHTTLQILQTNGSSLTEVKPCFNDIGINSATDYCKSCLRFLLQHHTTQPSNGRMQIVRVRLIYKEGYRIIVVNLTDGA
jgi:hypothetical protein